MQTRILAQQWRIVVVVWLAGWSASWAEGADQPPLHTLPQYSDRYTNGVLAPILAPGRILYVSPDGSDQNTGTELAPLRSLEAARDAIRKLKSASGLPKGGVHVVLMPGYYQRRHAFRLSSEDSGTADCPIVYRGTSGAHVVLSGGLPLDTSEFAIVRDTDVLARLPETARGNVMCVDLSTDVVAEYFPGDGDYGRISMDGHLLQLARWPNRGYHHIGEIIDAGPTTRWLRPGEQPAGYSKTDPTGGKFVFREEISPAVQAEFARTGDMRVQGYLHNDWYYQDEPIGKIDGQVVQLLRYTRYGIVDKIKSMPRRVRLVNVLAELDEMGEWYVDRHERRLYVWPIASFEPGVSRVTVLGGEPLIQCEETNYVTIRDLTLENTGEVAVEISGGKHNLLAGCVVRNGIGRGLSIEGGRYNGVTGCEFYGLQTAFHLAGGDLRTLEHCYHFATNNIIHDCRRRGYGLIGLSGVGIHFAHNLLYMSRDAQLHLPSARALPYPRWNGCHATRGRWREHAVC